MLTETRQSGILQIVVEDVPLQLAMSFYIQNVRHVFVLPRTEDL